MGSKEGGLNPYPSKINKDPIAKLVCIQSTIDMLNKKPARLRDITLNLSSNTVTKYQCRRKEGTILNSIIQKNDYNKYELDLLSIDYYFISLNNHIMFKRGLNSSNNTFLKKVRRLVSSINYRGMLGLELLG